MAVTPVLGKPGQHLQGLISFSPVLLHQHCLGRSPEATLAGLTPQDTKACKLLVEKTTSATLLAPSPVHTSKAISSQAVTALAQHCAHSAPWVAPWAPGHGTA